MTPATLPPILMTLITYFFRGTPTSKIAKLSDVQKRQAKELAEAEMNLAQCESNEEYYRHQAAFYRERIARLTGEAVTPAVGGSA